MEPFWENHPVDQFDGFFLGHVFSFLQVLLAFTRIGEPAYTVAEVIYLAINMADTEVERAHEDRDSL